MRGLVYGLHELYALLRPRPPVDLIDLPFGALDHVCLPYLEASGFLKVCPVVRLALLERLIGVVGHTVCHLFVDGSAIHLQIFLDVLRTIPFHGILRLEECILKLCILQNLSGLPLVVSLRTRGYSPRVGTLGIVEVFTALNVPNFLLQYFFFLDDPISPLYLLLRQGVRRRRFPVLCK